MQDLLAGGNTEENVGSFGTKERSRKSLKLSCYRYVQISSLFREMILTPFEVGLVDIP